MCSSDLLPILSTFFLSFTDYTGSKEFAFGNFNFVGLQNYARVFTDPQFGLSLGVTLRYVLFAVPLGLIIPLSFAVLLNSKHLMAKGLFRTLFFMPTIIPVVAGTFIFSEMGYASVLAVVLFVLVLILTALLFYFGQSAVYYAGEK